MVPIVSTILDIESASRSLYALPMSRTPDINHRILDILGVPQKMLHRRLILIACRRRLYSRPASVR